MLHCSFARRYRLLVGQVVLRANCFEIKASVVVEVIVLKLQRWRAEVYILDILCDQTISLTKPLELRLRRGTYQDKAKITLRTANSCNLAILSCAVEKASLANIGFSSSNAITILGEHMVSWAGSGDVAVVN